MMGVLGEGALSTGVHRGGEGVQKMKLIPILTNLCQGIQGSWWH